MTVTVYALVKDHRFVYVGQTLDLQGRLMAHTRRIQFDSHVVLETVAEGDDYLFREAKWLDALRGLGVGLPHNRLFPKPVPRPNALTEYTPKDLSENYIDEMCKLGEHVAERMALKYVPGFRKGDPLPSPDEIERCATLHKKTLITEGMFEKAAKENGGKVPWWL